jgi:hypothetical protein
MSGRLIISLLLLQAGGGAGAGVRLPKPHPLLLVHHAGGAGEGRSLRGQVVSFVTGLVFLCSYVSAFALAPLVSVCLAKCSNGRAVYATLPLTVCFSAAMGDVGNATRTRAQRARQTSRVSSTVRATRSAQLVVDAPPDKRSSGSFLLLIARALKTCNRVLICVWCIGTGVLQARAAAAASAPSGPATSRTRR